MNYLNLKLSLSELAFSFVSSLEELSANSPLHGHAVVFYPNDDSCMVVCSSFGSLVSEQPTKFFGLDT